MSGGHVEHVAAAHVGAVLGRVGQRVELARRAVPERAVDLAPSGARRTRDVGVARSPADVKVALFFIERRVVVLTRLVRVNGGHFLPARVFQIEF